MAYTNTLTGLIPVLYEAMHIVSRELVGLIPAVSRDSRAERAALNQAVSSPVAGEGTLEDITPGQAPPNTGGDTHSTRDFTITRAKASPVSWTGEEQRGLEAGSDNHRILLRDRYANAMRKIVNAVETDLASLYAKASRAYGTAGTTPFGTANNLTDVAQLRKILEDNGAPQDDLQLVLNTSAMAQIRGIQTSLWKVNEAGTEEMLREGFISQGLQGFAIRSSGQMASHTPGTGSGYLLAEAGEVGETALDVDTGTGTILAGDVVTFAGTDDKYIVKTPLTTGTITLQDPGLVAAEDDNDAVTVGAAYSANMAFHRSAIHLVTRAPAQPDGGDDAKDTFMLTDPLSGLTFEVRVYGGYHAVRHEVDMVWGYEVMNPKYLALLLG